MAWIVKLDLKNCKVLQWSQVEELKVSREIWTDHNEIVNHLPVSLMQVVNSIFYKFSYWTYKPVIPGGEADSTCCLKIVITSCRFGQAQLATWLAGWPRSWVWCGFWLVDSTALLLHLFHTLFVIHWNMGYCARYHGHWNIVPSDKSKILH